MVMKKFLTTFTAWLSRPTAGNARSMRVTEPKLWQLDIGCSPFLSRDFLLVLTATFAFAFAGWSEDLDAALQAKLTAKIALVQTWAADATLVKAVKAQNEHPAAEVAAMTQEKWKAAVVLDPFVRAFTKNEAAAVLKTKKAADVSEAFLSAADGTKVAFLNKPTNWSHHGKPKHDVPMSGQTWQGPVEVDDSSGVRQVQISVPVLDGGKAIGSLVVGINLTELKAE
jgi:hypothetical protein